MIRALISDVDGTLIDSVDAHADAWIETLRHFGFEADRTAMRRQIGKGADQLLPEFVPRQILAEKEGEISAYRSDLFKLRYLETVRPFPMVRELFARMRDRGVRTVLASSGTADEVEVYAAIAQVSDLVDVTVSADDAERSKPHGDIFAAALAHLSPLGPDETIVLGDTAWDVIAARKAGLRTVALRCGGFPPAELEASGPVAIYQDPADLLARFAGSPLA